ncbi:Indoleamine 2,3-dioxygenase [Metarhizium guizhouense ARSEF 977]|uniref:Indoleamine 2,3-dioxygenase n=1 Tax=Metarhizium guizhouense (strain ARSEF 977) TaxID=1276136 RepID=A0A0B4FU21_METGA|nr:Indoleamine 2,3-dioxygenase [Metarhizium guizhouense ARSEF 977]
MTPPQHEDFAVAAGGFLPDGNLLHAPPYYAAWDGIARDLPKLIPYGVRSAVDKLSILSTDGLELQDELRWAYVRLAFISQAYIRGGETPGDVRAHLPPQLAIPLVHISKRLGLQPVISYAATCLWNFRCESNNLSKPECLETLVTFTGTESESWFYRISIAIEARGAAVLPALVHALQAAGKCDYEPLVPALCELQSCIKDIIHLLQRMSERCDPMVFYNRIRPFLAGSQNVAEFPTGVFYDRGNQEGEWKQLRGGSNGQSTLLQVFDKVLSIDHGSNGAGTANFHDEMKEYMPAEHRRFLEQVERQRTIREVVMSLPAVHDIRAAYDAAIDSMYDLRSKHLSVVARYISVPSSKSRSERVAGTGGTFLNSFLRQARDNTKAAKV